MQNTTTQIRVRQIRDQIKSNDRINQIYAIVLYISCIGEISLFMYICYMALEDIGRYRGVILVSFAVIILLIIIANYKAAVKLKEAANEYRAESIARIQMILSMREV